MKRQLLGVFITKLLDSIPIVEITNYQRLQKWLENIRVTQENLEGEFTNLAEKTTAYLTGKNLKIKNSNISSNGFELNMEVTTSTTTAWIIRLNYLHDRKIFIIKNPEFSAQTTQISDQLEYLQVLENLSITEIITWRPQKHANTKKELETAIQLG